MTSVDGLDDLRAAARRALSAAYAPYSHFRVGAALRSADGAVVTGCNVENASYGASLCAERTALATAVAGGLRRFDALAIASDATTPTPPCGMCRQVLAEFAPNLTVVSIAGDGSEARWTLDLLLPTPFLPAALDRT
ncbi:MAG: cytidine deaminase [Gemmatimonadaceae bacterium]